jgi:DNA-binding response OmpR family regulator
MKIVGGGGKLRILHWTRCSACTLQILNELVQMKHQVITISDMSCISVFKLNLFDIILFYWPTFSTSELELCISIREGCEAPIYIISKHCEILDTQILVRNNLHIVTDLSSHIVNQFFSIASKKLAYPSVKEPELGLNYSKRAAIVRNKEVELSRREFQLLEYLFKRSGEVVDRDDIINIVWEGLTSDSNVYITIQKIRIKIELNPSYPKLLVTKRGGGYMLCN